MRHDPAPAAQSLAGAAEVRIAVHGFSPFEHTALASFFRLAEPHAAGGAAARTTAYVLVDDAARAALLIVDADDGAAVDAARRTGRLRDAVFIGAQAPAGARAWLPRPIAPMHIVRALDGLAQPHRSAAPDPATASPPAGVDVLLTDLGGPIDTATRIAPMRPQAGGAGRAVLVVDDSAIARRFLALRLERFGYRVQLASSGEQALVLFELQQFAIAFVDIGLDPSQAGGIDGLRVCQTIKRRGQPEAGGTATATATATAVVIVTGQSSATARVQGSLAGCDAYLTKPLMAPEFMAALRLVDPLFQWQAGSAAEPAEPPEAAAPEAAAPGAPMG